MVTGLFYDRSRDHPARARFNERETTTAPPVTVVDQFLADHVFPGQDPIGKRLRIDPADKGEKQMYEIVGVVRRMKGARTTISVAPGPLLPTTTGGTKQLHIAGSLEAARGTLERSIREAILSVDPAQPIFDVRRWSPGSRQPGRIPVS